MNPSMMRRALLMATVWLSCSPPARPCGPKTCEGCCDAVGECVLGNGVFECGAAGQKCSRCAPTEICSAGSCALFDGGEYDASFPGDPDANYNRDAGVFDASVPDSGADAGRPDAGFDAGRPDAGGDAGFDAGFDAGRSDAGSDAGRFDAGTDSGVDAGSDAGFDAGADAGDGG